MKKKVLVAALGIGLAASSLSQAESLLFPYVRTGGGAFTFISLQNIENQPITTHYIYNTGAVGGTDCSHDDSYGKLTANDLIQHEIAGPAGGVDLVGIVGDKSTAYYTLNPRPTEGFLIVGTTYDTGATLPAVVGGAGAEGGLVGQAIVVDANTGTVAAYRGMNNPNPLAAEDDFSSMYTSRNIFVMSWYPSSIVTTRWQPVVTGSAMATIGAAGGWNGGGTFKGVNQAFNNDEQPISGGRQTTVTCRGIYDRSMVLAPNQILGTEKGGWTLATFSADLDGAGKAMGSTATGAVMAKIEVTPALGGRGAVSMENTMPNMPY